MCMSLLSTHAHDVPRFSVRRTPSSTPSKGVRSVYQIVIIEGTYNSYVRGESIREVRSYFAGTDLPPPMEGDVIEIDDAYVIEQRIWSRVVPVNYPPPVPRLTLLVSKLV